ncbi:hypothetical protein NQP46_01705 [Streptomyces albus]|nr:hypothetical protein NQP46_01705 [Streptomyces albus]
MTTPDHRTRTPGRSARRRYGHAVLTASASPPSSSAASATPP